MTDISICYLTNAKKLYSTLNIMLTNFKYVKCHMPGYSESEMFQLQFSPQEELTLHGANECQWSKWELQTLLQLVHQWWDLIKNIEWTSFLSPWIHLFSNISYQKWDNVITIFSDNVITIFSILIKERVKIEAT